MFVSECTNKILYVCTRATFV